MDDIGSVIAGIKDSQIIWHCRFHPTNWWHEVGCPHQEWTKEQLLEAIKTHKKFEIWRINEENRKITQTYRLDIDNKQA